MLLRAPGAFLLLIAASATCLIKTSNLVQRKAQYFIAPCERVFFQRTWLNARQKVPYVSLFNICSYYFLLPVKILFSLLLLLHYKI